MTPRIIRASVSTIGDAIAVTVTVTVTIRVVATPVPVRNFIGDAAGQYDAHDEQRDGQHFHGSSLNRNTPCRRQGAVARLWAVPDG
jgi:hypothetical protein